MKKKGQALIEFVIILPILLLIILGIIDIGKVMYTKMILEEKISDVITYYQNKESNIDAKMELEKEGINLEIDEKNDSTKFILSSEVDILTPGLNLIFDNPYKVESTRSILNE